MSGFPSQLYHTVVGKSLGNFENKRSSGVVSATSRCAADSVSPAGTTLEQGHRMGWRMRLKAEF